jgi:hypothetical protein
MRQEQNVQVGTGVSPALERIQSEYVQLRSSTTFSLRELFQPHGFRFEAYCREFSPHPESEALKKIVEEFGRSHGIWLPNAKHHVTCALFLYPEAGFSRMVTMMKNLILGFYLNDTMGRDTFQYLSSAQKMPARHMILRMARLDGTLTLSPDADPLERINAEILREFRDHSPAAWFAHFMDIYCYHIGITHNDGNTDAQGHVPEIEAYMEHRCHLGGVHHILHWIEFSDGCFLDWSWLASIGAAQSLKRLHWVTAAFAGMSNDLFSFEKEVIDNDSDSNLMMIIALNRPGLSLGEVIDKAAEIVRNLLLEVLSLMNALEKKITEHGTVVPKQTGRLAVHLAGIRRCVQAIWTWHCHSGRYKREDSIWAETTLAAAHV